MTVPLWILAALSILAAVIGTPWWPKFAEFAGEAMAKSPNEEGAISLLPFAVAALIAWAGLYWAWLWYGKGLPEEGDPLMVKAPGFARGSAHKFWVDEIDDAFIVQPLWRSASALYDFADRYVIDGVFVNGSAWLTSTAAKSASPFENGDLSCYAGLTAIAVVGLMVWAMV